MDITELPRYKILFDELKKKGDYVLLLKINDLLKDVIEAMGKEAMRIIKETRLV
jgi:hypothetical protein